MRLVGVEQLEQVLKQRIYFEQAAHDFIVAASEICYGLGDAVQQLFVRDARLLVEHILDVWHYV